MKTNFTNSDEWFLIRVIRYHSFYPLNIFYPISNLINLSGVKEIMINGYVERFKPLYESWSDPSCAKLPLYQTFPIDACLFKGEYLLHGDGIPLHSGNFLKGNDLS